MYPLGTYFYNRRPCILIGLVIIHFKVPRTLVFSLVLTFVAAWRSVQLCMLTLAKSLTRYEAPLLDLA